MDIKRFITLNLLSRVCYVYSGCGHVYPMPDQEVQCDSPRCKFSPMHPKSCGGSSCKQTCKQFRQHPQQYSPQIAGYCPGCGGQAR
ncbi:hypothetical protein C8Q78DRAFT_979931 [Trametes maxima]|nr:hypothetical protein C8Q78DRAFT_979931 [Trametes maxima]